MKVDMPELPFVCTWCAGRFSTRAELTQHWMDEPECSASAYVSNPLQTKYGNANIVVEQPGEATLRRIRSKDCDHHYLRERLYDDDGSITGYQCTNCYTPLPSPYVPGSD